MKYVPDLANLRDVPNWVSRILSLVGDSGILWRAAEVLRPEEWKFADEKIEYVGRYSGLARDFRAAFLAAVIVALAERGSVSLKTVCRRVGISYARVHQLVTEDRWFIVWITRLPIYGLQGRINPLMNVLIDRLAENARLPAMDERGRPIARNAQAINRAGEVLTALLEAAK